MRGQYTTLKSLPNEIKFKLPVLYDKCCDDVIWVSSVFILDQSAMTFMEFGATIELLQVLHRSGSLTWLTFWLHYRNNYVPNIDY